MAEFRGDDLRAHQPSYTYDVRSRERRERIVASGWQIAETGGTAPPRDWGDALIPKEASRG